MYSPLDQSAISVSAGRRRDLLPMWMKVFLWIFLVMGLMVPVVAILGLMDIPAIIGIYGISATSVFSLPGLLAALLISFKSLVAYGMWTEKDWAINLATADAVIGIAVSTVVMVVALFDTGNNYQIRLEIFILIPYLLKLRRMAPEWKGAYAASA